MRFYWTIFTKDHHDGGCMVQPTWIKHERWGVWCKEEENEDAERQWCMEANTESVPRTFGTKSNSLEV